MVYFFVLLVLFILRKISRLSADKIVELVLDQNSDIDELDSSDYEGSPSDTDLNTETNSEDMTNIDAGDFLIASFSKFKLYVLSKQSTVLGKKGNTVWNTCCPYKSQILFEPCCTENVKNSCFLSILIILRLHSVC